MRRPWGLRARLTAAFAGGALLLSAALAALSYAATQDYLLRQRERALVRQAVTSAGVVLQVREPATSDEVPELLARLSEITGSDPVLLTRTRTFAASLAAAEELPAALRRDVLDGRGARQRYRSRDVVRLAVGVPLTDGVAYVEVTPLTELDRTLQVLSVALTLAALTTTLAGAALGLLTSRRLLRPVQDVAGAAARIASGALETRLAPTADRDLSALTASFNAMVDALAARVQRDAQFAGDVSHELRSPLTTLTTALSVLEARRHELPERSARALDLLGAEVHRFRRLVEDLLAISRDDAAGPELVLEEVRMAELVARSAVGVDVLVSPEATDALVLADKRRVERVVANLLDNAAQHAGGASAVRVTADSSAVRLVVEDSGPGVPVAHRQDVFERFHRGAAAGRRSSGDGVGLGLALVRAHVTAHGGRVWVEDAPGGGAAFTVELPRVPS